MQPSFTQDILPCCRLLRSLCSTSLHATRRASYVDLRIAYCYLLTYRCSNTESVLQCSAEQCRSRHQTLWRVVTFQVQQTSGEDISDHVVETRVDASWEVLDATGVLHSKGEDRLLTNQEINDTAHPSK